MENNKLDDKQLEKVTGGIKLYDDKLIKNGAIFNEGPVSVSGLSTAPQLPADTLPEQGNTTYHDLGASI